MENQRTLNLIIQQYNQLHNKMGEAFKGFGLDPMPGSIASKELAISNEVQTAFNQGSLLLEVASDHLSAFSREITEPILPFAAWTSIRSVLELSSISI